MASPCNYLEDGFWAFFFLIQDMYVKVKENNPVIAIMLIVFGLVVDLPQLLLDKLS